VVGAVALVVLLLCPAAGFTVVATPFLANGGRVSWYKGPAAHELIAYDAIVDPGTRNYEVYTINPDRSSPQCFTCSSPLRKGFTGQPSWHPDGEHLVLQVESANSRHGYFNHMAWGFDNELWIIKRDGTEAELIWATPAGYAALHPHFSPDGTKLIFTERATAPTSPQNPWDNWRIRIADVDLTRPGPEKLSNVVEMTPNGPGFYEVHEFTADGRIVYSYTAGGQPYVDDVYTARIDGSDSVNLLNSPTSWDEHGHFSPNYGVLAYISSRFDPPSSSALNLRTELYANAGGAPQRITFYNKTSTDRVIVKDFDWDRSGTRIVYLVSGPPLPGPQLWIVTFP
jgi:Tol biopolymer transport system component